MTGHHHDDLKAHHSAGLLPNLLVGIFSTRRGTYRVLYRINDWAHEVVVLLIEYR